MDLNIISEAITGNTTLTRLLKFEKFTGSITLHVAPEIFEIKVIEFNNQIRIEKQKIKANGKRNLIKRQDIKSID